MQPRRKKFVDPRLQSKFIFAFACVAGCCVLLQAVSAVLSLNALADRLPHDGPIVLDELGRTTLAGLLVSILLLVPLSIAVAIILTHRVAGPLYRMRMFLQEVARGERPADCRLRKGDELQDFCALLNLATAPIRQAEREEETGSRFAASVEDAPSLVPSADQAAPDTVALTKGKGS